jgi:predicted DNA-binding transcriptional regulator AlpA
MGSFGRFFCLIVHAYWPLLIPIVARVTMRSTTTQPISTKIAQTGDPLIGTAEVAAELMCHPVSVFRYMRERPDFPVPIRISANRLAWRLSVIRAYVASRPLRESKKSRA